MLFGNVILCASLTQPASARFAQSYLFTANDAFVFNHRRLYEACGDIPPAELETAYYRQTALAEAGQATT